MKAFPTRGYNKTDKEYEENWRQFYDAYKGFKLKPNWSIRVIPPFAGAAARFIITNDDTGKYVSVYLDTSQSLGYYVDRVHWEIYPDVDDNNSRFEMIDIDGMMKAIEESLEKNDQICP